MGQTRLEDVSHLTERDGPLLPKGRESTAWITDFPGLERRRKGGRTEKFFVDQDGVLGHYGGYGSIKPMGTASFWKHANC